MLLEFSAANPESNSWECLKHGWFQDAKVGIIQVHSGKWVSISYHVDTVPWALRVLWVSTASHKANGATFPKHLSWDHDANVAWDKGRARKTRHGACGWKNEKAKKTHQQQQQDYSQIWTEATQHPTAICQVEAQRTWWLIIAQNDLLVLKALIVRYRGWRQVSCVTSWCPNLSKTHLRAAFKCFCPSSPGLSIGNASG